MKFDNASKKGKPRPTTGNYSFEDQKKPVSLPPLKFLSDGREDRGSKK